MFVSGVFLFLQNHNLNFCNLPADCKIPDPFFMKITRSRLFLFLPFLLLLVPYGTGLFLDLMDVDAAQYATMARQMMDTDTYLQIFNREESYLDKPPLVFWLAVLSYKTFGITPFAYRLPSFLSTLLGIYATYGLAKRFYTEKTAYLAALLLASCQAYFLFNHDVRTDTLLTNFVITALWQLALFLDNRKFLNLITGFVCIGLAMLAKGMLGLMVPGLAFAVHFALRREWKQFLRWEWLLGTLVIALVLLPMCLGLYAQHGMKGIRFFFWTQSFGRITGENVWKNDADAFFFVHTFLWSFLPWSLLFVAGLFVHVRNLFTSRFRLSGNPEFLTLGGFVLPYLALSASQFQLPHYIYVLFPLAAILTADYTEKNVLSGKPGIQKAWLWGQGIILVLLWVLGFLLAGVVFPMTNAGLWLITLLFCGGSLYLLFRRKNDFYKRIILASVLAMAGVNFVLNAQVYASLFAWQSEMVAARWVRSLPGNEPFYWYKEHMPSLDFYSYRVVPNLSRAVFDTLSPGSYLVYTSAEGLKEIQTWGRQPEVVKTFEHFHISTLSPDFLNPATRHQATETRYLLRLRKSPSLLILRRKT